MHPVIRIPFAVSEYPARFRVMIKRDERYPLHNSPTHE